MAEIPFLARVTIAGPGGRWLSCLSAFCPHLLPLPPRVTITSIAIWVWRGGRTPLSTHGSPGEVQVLWDDQIAQVRWGTFPSIILFPALCHQCDEAFPTAQWVTATLVWLGLSPAASRLPCLLFTAPSLPAVLYLRSKPAPQRYCPWQSLLPQK